METKSKNLPAVIDFTFEETNLRTIFNTETQTGYVFLADLLNAMGSTTNPAHVILKQKGDVVDKMN